MGRELRDKLKQFLRDPIGHIDRRLFFERMRRKFQRSYENNPEAFWKERLSKFKFSPFGTGAIHLSKEENERLNENAKKTLWEVLREEGVIIQDISVIDIGCGNGLYTDIFQKNGCKNYVGADITDVLFAELRRRYPEYTFIKLDVTKEEIPGSYDLILMIDVTQHIVGDRDFSFAMQNVGEHLSEDGLFVVTSWLGSGERRSFYEVSRPLERYRCEFQGYIFSQPRPFRDKFIFTVRKPKKRSPKEFVLIEYGRDSI